MPTALHYTGCFLPSHLAKWDLLPSPGSTLAITAGSTLHETLMRAWSKGWYSLLSFLKRTVQYFSHSWWLQQIQYKLQLTSHGNTAHITTTVYNCYRRLCRIYFDPTQSCYYILASTAVSNSTWTYSNNLDTKRNTPVKGLQMHSLCTACWVQGAQDGGYNAEV